MQNNFKINTNFENFIKIFVEENLRHNLISKNDVKFLYEKHIYDSLAIKLFFQKYGYDFKKILDIGCGGGFPCVPIAIEYPEMSITGIDSIQKKINSVNNFKIKLGLNNLNLVCDRVENIKNVKYDLIVSRAVANLSKIIEYALPIMRKNGYFIAYKSKKCIQEIDDANFVLKKFNARVVDIIEYNLPLDEIYERNLVVIKNV